MSEQLPQIDLIRQGYKAKLELEFGGFKCPCRILPADIEAKIIATARASANKIPDDVKRDGKYVEAAQSIQIQKDILFAACTVGPTSYLGKETLDALSASELDMLYDKYRAVIKTADPHFEDLPIEDIEKMIADVKKKKTTPRDYYISDLAALGRYFLAQISQKANGPG